MVAASAAPLGVGLVTGDGQHWRIRRSEQGG